MFSRSAARSRVSFHVAPRARRSMIELDLGVSVAKALIRAPEHSNPDLAPRAQVAGCCSDRNLVGGFLRNIAHAGLAIPRHSPPLGATL